MTNKICNTCNIEKPVEKFGINRVANSTNYHAGNLTSYKGDCKPCLSKKAKAYRDANPDLWKKYKLNNGKQKDFIGADKLLISAIRDRVHQAKQRDKKKGNITTLNIHQMHQLYISQQGKCALTGVNLKVEKHSPLCISIDKIEPSKAYTPTNVQWVCWAANRAKGDLTMLNFTEMCKRVTEKCNDYPKGVQLK